MAWERDKAAARLVLRYMGRPSVYVFAMRGAARIAHAHAMDMKRRRRMNTHYCGAV